MTQLVAIEADIPDGWRAVAYRAPRDGEHFLDSSGVVEKAVCNHLSPWLVMEKIIEYREPELTQDFDKEIEVRDSDRLTWCSVILRGDLGEAMRGRWVDGNGSLWVLARIKA